MKLLFGCGAMILGMQLLAIAQDSSTTMSLAARLRLRLEQEIQSSEEHWIEFRHDLHQHPELSGLESRTAKRVADELERLGLEVRRAVGGHGIVAILRGKEPGRTLCYRADMDAVASTARDPVSYRSLTPGQRHICGHDVHTTVGVALASALSRLRAHWNGCVVFYFQGAEETGEGAKAMLDAGAIPDPAPEESYALHTFPLELGSIGVTPGRALGMRDTIRVRFTGQGDLMAAAGQVRKWIQAMNTLKNPDQALSESGDFLVARPSSPQVLDGTSGLALSAGLSLSSDGIRQTKRKELMQAIAAAEFTDVEVSLDWDSRQLPGVYNDPELVRQNAVALTRLLGPEGYVVDHKVFVQFSEDFGFFQDAAPGVMYWLGVSNKEKGTQGLPHSPNYVADDGAIAVGVRCMAEVLLGRLRADE